MEKFAFRIDGVEVKSVTTKNRKISGVIPAPGTKEILTRLDNVESQSMHGQIPLVWHRAEDFSIFDHAGNKWIDFTSTIFVSNVGHSNPRVLRAVTESCANQMIACYAYPNLERANYLEKLVKFAGPNFEKAFLLSAGTEATEAAMKLMKMHGKKNGKKKNLVVAIAGNWHGRTLGAQVLSSNAAQRDWISDAETETVHIAFPYKEKMSQSSKEFLTESINDLGKRGIDIKEDVCGVMLETFQGWGAYFYPKEYVQELRDICDQFGILLAFDEMQAGFGRTGRNFGYENYDVRADLLCCGKGMGGGLPISGVIGSAEVMDLPEVGNMSSTHSGNPMLCAVGSAVLDEILEKNLVSLSARNGELLHQELQNLIKLFPEHIQQINGIGMVAAIIFKEKYSGNGNAIKISLIAEKCFQKGLLVVHTGRESIKIGPPLTITKEALIEGVAVIREAMIEVFQ
jgi:4-aminobutyrate aminotransferase-like enzyme